MPQNDDRLYLYHLLVLAAGFLVGIVAAYAFMSIPFDFTKDLAQARKLGVMGRTILDGYPKQRDIINYAAVLGFPIFFGIGGWLIWVRGERYKNIAALLAASPSSQETMVGGKMLFALVAMFYLVISYACYRSPIYGKLASMLPWLFMGEEGQYLAWVQSILNGGIYGRDFHCLYGPMLIYPLVWFMKVIGTTAATFRLYCFFHNLAAYGIIVTFLYRTLRFKTTFVVAAAVYLWVFPSFNPSASYLRVTLGMLPILLVYLYQNNPGKWLLIATGLILGQSVLFSQEVGVCSTLAVIATFFVWRLPERRFRILLHEAGIIFAGGAVSVAPMLGYFIANGVLGNIVKNLMAHPRLLALGFTTLPFPDIRVFLHAPFAEAAPIFYSAIFVYILSALYLVPLLILGRRDRNTLLRMALLVFGIFLYRSVLARSDAAHGMFVLPPAVLLVYLFVDDAMSGLKTAVSARRVTQIAVIILSIIMLALVSARSSPFSLWRMAASYRTSVPQLPRMGVPASPETSDTIAGIHSFLEANTRPGEYVCFFPNEAAFYFIFNRNNPTRYANAIFAGTTEQRLEMIRDLELKRPAYVIYNLNPIGLDGIRATHFVPEVDGYIRSNYQPVGQYDSYLFLKRVGT
jgi:hypothetical protein